MEYKNMEGASSPNELVQSTSNYKRYEAYLSRYRYARVPLNNVSSTTVPLSLNATQLMEWKIPAKTVINLSRSYISYSYTVQPLAGQNAVIFETSQDLCQWCYFGDGGGLGIVDVNYADRYTNVINPLRTATQEFLSKDQMNTSYPSVQYGGIAQASSANLPHGFATVNVLPFSQEGTTVGATYFSANDFIEQQYLRIGPAANTLLIVNRQLKLSTFKDTFVGMDKNCIFGRDMYLRMNTQYGARLGFFTTTPATPGIAANVTAFTATTMPQNYNGVYLYLAVEENKVLVDSLMSALLAGSIRYAIPYTYVYRYGATGASSNMSITLTRQFGHKLKRILFASFNGSETSNQSFNHSNFNGTKIKTLQSSIDSRPLTDYQLNCFNPNNGTNPLGVAWQYPSSAAAGESSTGDDYREMRDKLVGSCICSYLSYQINWCYADQWGLQSMIQGPAQSVDDANVDDGLNLLDADHVYTLQLTTPAIVVATNANTDTVASLAHYLFALFVRNLAISADGISFY